MPFHSMYLGTSLAPTGDVPVHAKILCRERFSVTPRLAYGRPHILHHKDSRQAPLFPYQRHSSPKQGKLSIASAQQLHDAQLSSLNLLHAFGQLISLQ